MGEPKRRHFVATDISELAMRAPGGMGVLVRQVLAFGLSSEPSPHFPLLLDEPCARQFLAELSHPDVEAVLQHAPGQRNEEGVTDDCPPPWDAARFLDEDHWRLLETVHVEPGDDWESLRLICGLGGSENRTSVSALAGSRLRAALGTYLSVVDLNDPDGEWAD